MENQKYVRCDFAELGNYSTQYEWEIILEECKDNPITKKCVKIIDKFKHTRFIYLVSTDNYYYVAENIKFLIEKYIKELNIKHNFDKEKIRKELLGYVELKENE